MGILRDSGSTNFNIPQVGEAGTPPHDALLGAVRKAAAGEYEVFGEITRGEDSSVVYLARDVADTRLLVLKLTPGSGGEYVLEVVKELDSSVAAPEGACPSCRSPLRQWGRYCTRCGSDLWGDPSFSGEWSRQELLQAVKEIARDRFEILGEVPRAEGGGFVYFGRDLTTGKVMALRLLKESADAFSLGQTGLLKRMARSSRVERGSPPDSPAPEPLPAEPLPPEPVLPEVLGAPPPQRPPPAPVYRSTPPARPVYREPWTQVAEYLRQPVVVAVIAITAVVVLVTLCTIAISSGGPEGGAGPGAARETGAPPPAAERAASLEETVLAYSVAIASFGSLEEARDRQRQLAGAGPLLYTAPTLVRGSVYYRLFAGMLIDRAEARSLLSLLVDEGIKGAVRDWDVRPTALAFFFGTYPTRREADLAIEGLLRRDIPAYRVPAATGGVASGYHVYAGGYETAAEARFLQEQITGAGLDPELVERVGLPVP